MKHPLCFGAALAVLAIHSFPGAPTLADVGFWPRSDVDIRVRFENLNDYPNYDFYLKYGLGSGNPRANLHQTRMHSDIATRLEGKSSRVSEAYLLAVPRGHQVQPPPNQTRGEWLTEVPNGCLQTGLLPGPNMQTRFSEQLNGYTMVYRIRFDGDRIDVTLVRADAPWSWWMLLIAFVLSAVFGIAGIRWLRRFRRRPQQAAGESSADTPALT